MNARLVPRLALVLVAIAGSAAAQTPAPTRAQDAADARHAKAAVLTPFEPGRVERVLTTIERGSFVQRALMSGDGVGVRFGGIENGAGIALGPSFRASNLLNGGLQIHASGAASIASDRQIEGGLVLAHAAPRFALAIDAVHTFLAQERFFGTGQDSLQSDATAFALETTRASGRATVAATRWLTLSAAAGTLRASAADGRARVPAIGSRFTDADAPGLGQAARFHVFEAHATVDYRDEPQNPRRGARYHVGVERHADAASRHSFTRVEAEIEQHLSAWKGQRLLTIRGIASASIADRGQQVPFYLQPTLGGSRLLRGFVTDRFRDNARLALQAEYGWDLSPFLNAVVFYEAGAVAPRLRDLTASALRRDYGIGFRFGSARTVALRTDVAFGSGEGTRLTMRFNHAF